MTVLVLTALLDYARTGDTVVVVVLDRLGRSLSGVIRTVETLTEVGVLLRSLREGIDYSTSTGRILAFSVSCASIYRALQSAELMALAVPVDAATDGVRVGS